MITFEEAIELDVQEFIVSPGTKQENSGFFTNMRIDKSSIPEGWYAYDIRGNGNSDFVTIEEKVLVNHTGTFLTKKPIQFTQISKDGRKYKYLKGRGGYTFV